MQRVVGHRHGRRRDRVGAARRVRGGRGAGGVGPLLGEGDGGALALELGGGDLLEGFVVVRVALAGRAARRGKEAEGVAGGRGVVQHVAALALEEGGVGRVCGAWKHRCACVDWLCRFSCGRRDEHEAVVDWRRGHWFRGFGCTISLLFIYVGWSDQF